jgi:Xaa-Pro aminopeptidase
MATIVYYLPWDFILRIMISMDVFRRRTEKAIETMRERGVRELILCPGVNMYYLTDFEEEPMERPLFAVFGVDHPPFFIAPAFYEEQIKRSTWVKDIRLYQETQDPYTLFDPIKGKVALDDRCWAMFSIPIQKILKSRELVLASFVLKDLRLRKSSEEIGLMRRAGQIADHALESILAEVKPGVTEGALAAMLEYQMRIKGGQKPSFDLIIASGPNSAMPHKRASDKRIKRGENVVVDFGCVYHGYCSDTTRTIFVGEPTDEMVEVYQIVLQAHELAFRTVKAGAKAKDVDLAARDYIESQGYGPCFTHRTGHGIGLAVHEEPYIGKEDDQRLEEGMAFSIEPGIYLPGKFGVRIEDIVVITPSGAISLNKFTKEIVVV